MPFSSSKLIQYCFMAKHGFQSFYFTRFCIIFRRLKLPRPEATATMKYIVFTLCFLLVVTICSSQNVNFEWVKTLSRSAAGRVEEHLIGVDGSKNVYIAGHFKNTHDLDPGPGVYNVTSGFLNDIFVTKLDPKGNFIWGRQLGGERRDDIYSFAVDAEGNAYFTGMFDGPDADFDPGPGVYYLNSNGAPCAYVCKLDKDGNLAWARQFSGELWAIGYSIAVDETGNVYTTGEIEGIGDLDPGPAFYTLGKAAITSPYVSKLDKNGNFIWANVLQTDYTGKANYLRIDHADNVYIAGLFQRSMDFDPGPETYILGDINNTGSPFLAKFDRDGNFIWGKKDVGNGVFAVDHNQHIYLFGGYYPLGNGVITKLDAKGDTLWSKRTGSGWAVYEYSTPIQVDGDGNIYTAGRFRFTQDFDPGPGVYNIASYPGNTNTDVAISKLDTDGNFIWAKQISGVGNDTPYGMVLDSNGNIYTTGTFYIKTDFDPGPEVYNLNAGSGGAVFVHKMNACQGQSDTTITANICNNYSLNGITYDTTGVYYQYLANMAGCDSVVRLDLTISGFENTVKVEACESYFWEGQLYTTSGHYSKRFPLLNGCDSILNLDLTVGHSSAIVVNKTLCDWVIDFEGYSSSGTYIDTFKTAAGCDSIRTLHLTFKAPSVSTTTVSICEGESFWGYTKSGTYADLFLTHEGCDSTRILHLKVNPIKFTTTDVAICKGTSWYAGGTLQNISGIYSDTLSTVNGCDSIIITNLVVHPLPVIQLGPDKDLCAGEKLILNPGTFHSYLWQDRSTASQFVAETPGTYSVKVSDGNNCFAYDEVKVNKLLPVPTNFLREKDSICENEKIQVTATGTYRNYNWSTGSIQPILTVQAPGSYALNVEDLYGCKGSDTIRIVGKYCVTGIFIPNAFTPNNDLLNDRFGAKVYGEAVTFRLDIFDRNGQLIYRTSDPHSGWDGTYKNISLPMGTYVWQCYYQLLGKEARYEKGTVTLLRN